MSTIRVNTLANQAGTESTAIENAINGSAKAWVNFNGTGTVAVRASYNVSSITDNNAGDYTVNFTNALADGNYCVIAMTGQPDAGGTTRSVGVGATGDSGNAASYITTSSVRLLCQAGTGTNVDSDYNGVAIFR